MYVNYGRSTHACLIVRASLEYLGGYSSTRVIVSGIPILIAQALAAQRVDLDSKQKATLEQDCLVPLPSPARSGPTACAISSIPIVIPCMPGVGIVRELSIWSFIPSAPPLRGQWPCAVEGRATKPPYTHDRVNCVPEHSRDPSTGWRCHSMGAGGASQYQDLCQAETC